MSLITLLLKSCDGSHGVSDGVFVSRIPRPRDLFSAPGSDELLAEFHRVAAHGFGVTLEEKSTDGVRDHVIQVDELFVLHSASEVLGFASTRHRPDEDLLYLHGMVLDPSVQGRGFSRILMEAKLEATPFSRVGFTTQNPVMFCIARSFVRQTFPSPLQPIVPEALRPLGMRLVPEGLSPNTFVVRERYSKCLYPSIPESRDSTVNQWFASSLEIRDGQTRNAFLILGNL
ncbi:MAG: GNAT family N-acetyltransferase [Nanoarchaeota archaeon]|nr:GNAT family N-acetyltransferase [Nanoarchaeota archaeon]